MIVLSNAKQSTQNEMVKNKLLFLFCMLMIMSSLFLVCYICFFRTVTIDVTKDMKIEYSGESGAATVMVTNTSNNLNQRTQEFLDTIVYTVTPNAKLSNGTKITIQARYNQELADKYHIQVINETKEITISGLEERFSDAKQITKEFQKKIDQVGNDYLDKNITEILQASFELFDHDSDIQLVDQKHIYRLFLKSLNKENKDKIIDIYQIFAKGTVSNENQAQVGKEEAVYYVITYDNINSSLQIRDESVFGESWNVDDISTQEKLIPIVQSKYQFGYRVSILKDGK